MEQEQKQIRYKVVPAHTPSLTHALSVAMTRGSMVWREWEKGTPFSAKELADFAKRQDKEHPLAEHQYYLVSREGAIGISPGLEWLTRWMFVPMEDCKERDFMMMKMREDLQIDKAVRHAIEQAVTEGLAKEKAQKAAAGRRNFCTQCGAKIKPGDKFCTRCGTRLIP